MSWMIRPALAAGLLFVTASAGRAGTTFDYTTQGQRILDSPLF